MLNTYDITLNFSREVDEYIASISKEINSNFDSSFLVDNVRFFPHVSMYIFGFPEEQEGNLIEIFNSFAKEMAFGFPVKFTGLKTSKTGLIFIEVEDKSNFVKIHNNILDVFNPLRGDILRDKYLGFRESQRYTQEEKKSIELYGHPFTASLFDPHISIANTSVNIQKEILEIYSHVFKDYETKVVATSLVKAVRTPQDHTQVLSNYIFK